MDKNKDILYKVKDIMEDFKSDSSSALKNVNRLLKTNEGTCAIGDINDVFQDCLSLWDMHDCLDAVMDDLESHITEMYAQVLTDNGFSVHAEFPSIISITYCQKDGQSFLFHLNSPDILGNSEKTLKNLKSGNLSCPAKINLNELENFWSQVCKVLEDAYDPVRG